MVKPETIATVSRSKISRVSRIVAVCHADPLPVMGEDGLLIRVVPGVDILRGFAERSWLDLWGQALGV